MQIIHKLYGFFLNFFKQVPFGDCGVPGFSTAKVGVQRGLPLKELLYFALQIY
jgi:hypothetical protein